MPNGYWMKAEEHAKKADKLLEDGFPIDGSKSIYMHLAEAQVHATLALAYIGISRG